MTVFLFLSLFSTLPVWAQSEIETGTLIGIITDHATSSPILGASISIVGTSIDSMADEHGEYEIEDGTIMLNIITPVISHRV